MLPARLFSRPAVTCSDIRCERFTQGLPKCRATTTLRDDILSPARLLPFRRVGVVCQAKANSKDKAKRKAAAKKSSTGAKKSARKREKDGQESGGSEGVRSATKSGLMRLTKAALQAELESFGCETIGKKQDLVDRLYNALHAIDDMKDPLSGLSFSTLMSKKKKYLREACEKRGIKNCTTKEEMVTAILEFFERDAESTNGGTVKAKAPDLLKEPTEQELLGLKMIELRAICDERGLPCAGKKAAVVKRILASFEPEKGLDLHHLQASYVGEEGLKAMTKAELLAMFAPSGLDFEGLTKPQIIKEINRGFALAVEKVETRDDSEEKEVQKFLENASLELEARIVDEGERIDEPPPGYVETEEPPDGKALVGNVDRIIDELVNEVDRVYGQYIVDEDGKTEPSYTMHGDDADDDVWDALMEEDVITDMDVRERLAQKRAMSGGRFPPAGRALSGVFQEPTVEELQALEKEASAFEPNRDDFDANFEDDDVDRSGTKDDGDDVVGRAFQEVSDIQNDEGIGIGGYDTQSRKELFQGSLKSGDDIGEGSDDDIISTGLHSRKRRRRAMAVEHIDFDEVLASMDRDHEEPDEEELNTPIDTSEFTDDDEQGLADVGSASMILQELDESRPPQRGLTFPTDVNLFDQSDQTMGTNMSSSRVGVPQAAEPEAASDKMESVELNFGDDGETSEKGEVDILNAMEPDDNIATASIKPSVLEVEEPTMEEETAVLDEGPFLQPPECEAAPKMESTGDVDGPDIGPRDGEVAPPGREDFSGAAEIVKGPKEAVKEGSTEEDTFAQSNDNGPESRLPESAKLTETRVDEESTGHPPLPAPGGNEDPGQQDDAQFHTNGDISEENSTPEATSGRREEVKEDIPSSFGQSESSPDSGIDLPKGAKENMTRTDVMEDPVEVDVSVPALSSEAGTLDNKNGKEDVTEIDERAELVRDFATVDEIKQKVEVQRAALRKVREETKKKKTAISEIKARIEASDKKQDLSLIQMKRLLEVTENIKAQRKSWQESMEARVETLRIDANKTVKNQDLKAKLESSIKELEGEFQMLRDHVEQRNKEADALKDSINRGEQNLENVPGTVPVKGPYSESKPQGQKVGDRIQDKSPILAVAALGLTFFEASGLSKLFGGTEKKRGKSND